MTLKFIGEAVKVRDRYENPLFDFSMFFSAKSKTFLVGEYSVLFGGNAIVLTTTPEFRLHITKSESGLININKGSPAHKFYLKHNNTFQNLSIIFHDPHHESGGLGASSAQFTLLYKLYLELTNKDFTIGSFLNEYKELASHKNNVIKASGADCVAQYYNHHIFFDSKNNLINRIEWNFENIDFAIFKTGLNVATHLHLQKLAGLDISELQNCVQCVKHNLDSSEEISFAKNIQTFFYILKKMGLVADQTYDLVEEFLKIDGVLAAKGCGAMSADTIIVIFNKDKKDLVKKAAISFKLKAIF